MKLTKLAVIAATLFASQMAVAQDNWADRAVYVGASVGQSRLDLNNHGLEDLTGYYSEDHRDRAFKVLVGKQFNRFIGVEASYFDLGDFNSNIAGKGTIPGVGYVNGSLNRDTSIRGGALDLVLTVPVTQRFGILGRVGAAHTRVSENGTAVGNLGSYGYYDDGIRGRESSTNLKAGLGLEFKFNDALALRGEVERYRLKDALSHRAHVNVATVGLTYKFGRPPITATRVTQTTYTTPATVVAPPTYQAPAAEPAPVTTTKKVRE